MAGTLRPGFGTVDVGEDWMRAELFGEKGMRSSIMICGVVWATAGIGQAQFKLTDSTTVVFAPAEEGRKILTTRDDFIRALSPFDRAARMKTDREVSEEAFLEFVGRSVLDWTEAEKAALTTALDSLRTPLARMALPWPKVIYLIKTAGAEEGDAAYTRAHALILPRSMLPSNRPVDARLICHELFHVLSRSNPDLRERLYAALGFVKCDEVEFPETLRGRKLTNPDAPANNHCIRVQVDGTNAWVVPLLFSRTEKYDVQRGGAFFRYMEFQFLLVEREGDSPRLKPVPQGQPPRLVGLAQVAGFFEQVGRNTQYIIHPEEILADNFASLVMQDANVPSPEIRKRLQDVLAEKPGNALGNSPRQ
jgi:hypothetical protein